MSSDAVHPRLRFRPDVPPPQRPTPRRRGIRRVPPERQSTPEVADDFPDVIPITSTELDVIETYLGRLISQLLGEVAEEPTATKEGEELC
jgi:hypothetical protein